MGEIKYSTSIKYGQLSKLRESRIQREKDIDMGREFVGETGRQSSIIICKIRLREINRSRERGGAGERKGGERKGERDREREKEREGENNRDQYRDRD